MDSHGKPRRRAREAGSPMNPKAERVRSLLQQAVKEAGFENGESGTEAFLVELEVAIRDVKKEMRASHRQGLCLDCTTALAYKLVPRKRT
jgi:hypothetical protein